MSFLDRFRPQPAWKSSDPAVRASAVRTLGAHDRTILESLARADADPGVRRMALQKLGDPALLAEAARGDADAAVRERATELLLEVALSDTPDATAALGAIEDQKALATAARDAARPEVRRSAAARLSSPRALLVVAKTGTDSALRLSALARLDDPALLAEVALKSEHKDVALAALERLDDPEQLRQVAARGRSRAASRRAKARLEAARAAEAPAAPGPAPDDPATRVRDLAETLEAFASRRDWVEMAAELATARAAWAELGPRVDDLLARRFLAAAEALDVQLAGHARERAEAERQAAESARRAAERVALCEAVEAATPGDAPAEVDRARAAWQALEAWEAPDADALRRRFDAACEAALGRHEGLRTAAERGQRMEELCRELEQLAEKEDLGEARRRWRALQKGWSGLQSMDGLDASLQERYARAVGRLESRFAEARADREKREAENAARLEALAARLEALAAAAQPSLKESERALRELRAVLGDLGPLPTREDRARLETRLKAARQALYPRVQELRDTEDWKRWASEGLREELARKAEALVASEDVAEAAKVLRDLEEQWKQASLGPRDDAGEAVWQRFRTARDTVRQRAQDHFQKKDQERTENLREKEALCARAEALAESSDWDKAAEELKGLQGEWQKVGPVPRAQADAVWARFRKACDTFFERRKKARETRETAWAENLARKEALCLRAEALAGSTEWRKASAEIKQLQVEWKAIGPVRRNKADAVWGRFRAACDRFFERYKEQRGPKPRAEAAPPEAPKGPPADPEQARAEALQRREALCAEIEELAREVEPRHARATDPAALAAELREALAANTMRGRGDQAERRRAVADRLKRARAEWKATAAALGEGAAEGEMESRFAAACERIEAALTAA